MTDKENRHKTLEGGAEDTSTANASGKLQHPEKTAHILNDTWRRLGEKRRAIFIAGTSAVFGAVIASGVVNSQESSSAPEADTLESTVGSPSDNESTNATGESGPESNQEDITQDNVEDLLARVAQENPDSVLGVNEKIDSSGAITKVEYSYEQGGLYKQIDLIDDSTYKYELVEPGIKTAEHPDVNENLSQPSDDDPEEILNHLLYIKFFAYSRIDALADDEHELRILQQLETDSLEDTVIKSLNTIGNLTTNSKADKYTAHNTNSRRIDDNEYEVTYDEHYGDIKHQRLQTTLRKDTNGNWKFADQIIEIENYLN